MHRYDLPRSILQWRGEVIWVFDLVRGQSVGITLNERSFLVELLS